MKTGHKVGILYIVAVIFYALWIHMFSIPVHFEVDEELYISMAKSFHYTGKFIHEGMILNYSCVLYSMLLSVAYFFYSPETILFSLRLVGLSVMLTSVFPIYLLGRKMLGEEKKAFLISCLFCILPSVTNAAYCMQEVLCYPLFLWFVYFLYCEIRSERLCSLSREFFWITVLSALCYFTKTYMIFVPLMYCFLVFLESVHMKRWQGVGKIIAFIGGYGALYVCGKRLILFCNQGIAGTNHYADQFSNLFPIKGETVLAAVCCCLIYLAALLFYWGVLPVFLPLVNLKKYDEKDRKMSFFLLVSIMVLIAEIVISIVLTEEGNVLFPHKILYRYFQILEVPLLLMFLKKWEAFEIPRWTWIVYVVVLGGLAVYYVCIGKNQRTAIMDAPLFLLMENINRYVIPHFNLLACFLSAILVGGTVVFKRKGIVKQYCKSFLQVSLAGVVLFFLVNLVQLPLYTNVIAKGKKIEESAINVAKQLDEGGLNSYPDGTKTVYYTVSTEQPYARAIYAYLKTDVINLSAEELDEVSKEETVIISWNEESMHYRMDLQ